MILSLTYKFVDLPLREFQAKGVAEIEFKRNGEWEIYTAVLTGLTDADGEARDDYVSTDTLKAALIAEGSEGIQEAVTEALDWEMVS